MLLSLGMGTNLVGATSSNTGALQELEVDGAWITQSVLKKTINDERRWLSTTWIFQT